MTRLGPRESGWKRFDGGHRWPDGNQVDLRRITETERRQGNPKRSVRLAL